MCDTESSAAQTAPPCLAPLRSAALPLSSSASVISLSTQSALTTWVWRCHRLTNVTLDSMPSVDSAPSAAALACSRFSTKPCAANVDCSAPEGTRAHNVPLQKANGKMSTAPSEERSALEPVSPRRVASHTNSFRGMLCRPPQDSWQFGLPTPTADVKVDSFDACGIWGGKPDPWAVSR
eukprot:3869629-Prymnesium_polylepis.2